jgi:hypothetical protein
LDVYETERKPLHCTVEEHTERERKRKGDTCIVEGD